MSPLRLLHVDDSEIDTELVRRLAARVEADLRVEHANDGDVALSRLEAARASGALPHLVLLDLNMPRLGGHACLRAIRADPALDAVVVIVLTTSMRSVDREAAAREGAAGYLVKPLTREVLTGIAGRVSQLHRASVDPAGG